MMDLLRRIPSKPMMIGYLSALFITSSLALGVQERLINALIVIALYVVFDLLWSGASRRTWYPPYSSVISGLILALIGPTASPISVLIALPALAVLSKRLLRFGRPRHIFNPATFALGIAGIFSASASWWGVAWGSAPTALVGLSGIGILWRQKRFHVFFPFIVAYAIGLSAVFLINSISVGDVGVLLLRQLLDGTTLFFGTVMVIEPVTSHFPAAQSRRANGAIIGIATALMTYLSGTFGLDHLDPLIWGLLVGNLTSSIAFLPKTR